MSERFLFAGTPEFAATILGALLEAELAVVGVLTQPDRPKGRGRSMSESSVKQLALEYQLPLLQPPTLKDPALWPALAAFGATRLIVVAYGLLLPKAVLTLASKGCLNVHASLLPRWRGAAPIQHALLAGDQETGISLMQMEEGLDTGPILAQRTLPIKATDTYQDLHDALATLGANLLIEYLKTPQTTAPILQDNHLATYASKLQKEDTVIHWEKPATILERQLRAFFPQPACTTFLNGTLIKIIQASVASTPTTEIPGTLLEILPRQLAVATGEGQLLLEQLQFPGKKPILVSELVRTRTLNMNEGMVFG